MRKNIFLKKNAKTVSFMTTHPSLHDLDQEDPFQRLRAGLVLLRIRLELSFLLGPKSQATKSLQLSFCPSTPPLSKSQATKSLQLSFCPSTPPLSPLSPSAAS
jgi:hypothetical protein